MKKNLFPLLLLAVSTTFAKDAGKAETPEQIVQKLYRVYQEENATDNGVSFDNYASAEIKALFDKDEQLADGEMGCIDYDFIIQGQDYDAASIKRTLKIKTLDKKTPSQQPSKISMSRPPSPTNSTARRENARLPTCSKKTGKRTNSNPSKKVLLPAWRIWKKARRHNKS